MQPALAHSKKQLMTSLKIVYVEDQEVTRLGTLPFLKKISDNVTIFEAATYAELLKFECIANDIKLIILDLSLPDIEGTIPIDIIQQKFRNIPLVVFSASDDFNLIMQAIDDGIDGFITKRTPAKTIEHILKLVLAGEKYFPSHIVNKLASRDHRNYAEKSNSNPELSGQQFRKDLTPRQYEVLHLISLGLTNKQIAKNLEISPGTAKNHVAEVLRILKFQNRREAIYEVLSNNTNR